MCGTNDVRTQRRLLSQKEPKFAEALEIAQAMESATRNAQDLSGMVNSKSVYKLTSPSSKGDPLKGRCYRCGCPDHRARDCRHIDTVCHNCGIKGHLAAVCRKPKQTRPQGSGKATKKRKGHRTYALAAGSESETDKDAETFSLYTITGVSTDPYMTTVDIDGESVEMEIDTGAAVSVMNAQV